MDWRTERKAIDELADEEYRVGVWGREELNQDTKDGNDAGDSNSSPPPITVE